MATQMPTLTEQVFASRSTNLSVTRFAALDETIQGGLQRKIAPGLRYAFGRDSGVTDSEGFDIPVGGSVRVDEALRRRDAEYISRYGMHYPPETDAALFDADDPDDSKRAYLKRAFLSTEDFLRQRSALTGDFRELPPVAPGSQDDLRKVTDLVIDGDVAGLLALYEVEEAEWGRPDVLEAAQSALSRLAERAEAQPPAA